ncbi:MULTISPECIES: hypothetical protein [Burkholderia]|uniref:hypothetical protein n=1 Tax=Burkholderia TaxID=32008 RepID=UPI0011D1DD6E|nr:MULTISPECIES: hypothetical protein [Burkholderia]MBJ9920642.1 hypothetical protein [Burkholderia cenocepacia]
MKCFVWSSGGVFPPRPPVSSSPHQVVHVSPCDDLTNGRQACLVDNPKTPLLMAFSIEGLRIVLNDPVGTFALKPSGELPLVKFRPNKRA